MSNNALHKAAEAGNLAEVRSQVNSFDINAKGVHGATALVCAADGGKIEIVKLLLSLNADVNIPNVSTLTVLYDYLICIFSFHISIPYHPLYTSQYVLLSRVVDVPPSTFST